MRKIDEIIRVEKKTSSKGEEYYRTCIVSDGDEVVGYGKDFKVGDRIEVFFDEAWGVAKFQKYRGKSKVDSD